MESPVAAPATLLGRKDVILRGVDMTLWGPYIDSAKLDAALSAIDAAGDADCIAPPDHLILEPLRYGGPDDYVAVALAQDPYPTAGEAMGICFSVPRTRALPESLKRIFGCLDRAGLRREHLDEKSKPITCGDLRPWAVQGVLMINAALTTRVGARRAHADHWKPFVDELVKRLCANFAAAGRRIHFLLWGGDARAYSAVARRHKHVVHEWSHPSPMADNKLPDHARFRMCPHFEEVNADLTAAGRRAIVWDNLSPVIAFSDGSCPLNGKPGARAGFAAVITGGQFGAAIVRGEVLPTAYALVDDADPERGLVATDALVAPSNNRGELMGLIYCFLALLHGRALGKVEVISDSEISVNTLTDWLPARLKKKTERELKNFDLVWIAWRLLGELRRQASLVVLTHTRSHQPKPPDSAPSRERFVWAGNHKADEHAGLPLKNEATYAVEVFNAPPVLKGLALPGATTSKSDV